jgi:recombination protein RecR
LAEFAEPLNRLIEAFRKLPGIGSKSAQRLALHVMKASRPDAEALSRALIEVKDQMRLCSVCFNNTDIDPCRYCTSSDRDDTRLCVVEEPNNLVVIERTGGFRGRYHVLGGALSPIHGRGPEALRIEPLMARIRQGRIQEVILATNPNVEGEATATYLARLLREAVPTVSRIAMGLPVGGDLDYVDVVTMTRALDGRREL